jgi:hypothetical protein
MSGTKKFLSDINFTDDVADTSVAGEIHGATSAAKEVAGGTNVLAFVVTPLHDTTDIASQMHTILGTANLNAASNLYDSLII